MGSSGNTGSPAAILQIPGVSSSWEAVEGYVSTVDLREEKQSWESRRAAGKALRKRTPREDHALWIAPTDRPDPVAAVNPNSFP
jgi:hypothetical protein